MPTAKLAAYPRIAKKAGEVWKDHGALEHHEWVADNVQPGKFSSFPQSVKLRDGETGVFAWIVDKSRKGRDRINANVMADSRPASMMGGKNMPCDGKRMFWDGFKTMVSL